MQFMQLLSKMALCAAALSSLSACATDPQSTDASMSNASKPLPPTASASTAAKPKDPASADPKPGGASAADVEYTVDQIHKSRAELNGKTVRVAGVFRGWTGQCKGGQKTKSDWMLESAGACVYVTGKLPPGIVAPPETTSNGTPLSIRAKVELAGDGLPYLVML
jgi:hypothetical protein